MPDGYDAQDAMDWVASINEAMIAITADAHQEVLFKRTWRVMEELGLGPETDETDNA